jgi:hypothetical protein
MFEISAWREVICVEEDLLPAGNLTETDGAFTAVEAVAFTGWAGFDFAGWGSGAFFFGLIGST